jgi:hypothetical protein
MSEHRNIEAERLGFQFGVIAANISSLLEGAYPTQARRSRYAGTTRQFHVRDPAVGLQVVKNPLIDLIEFDAPHVFILRSLPEGRNYIAHSGFMQKAVGVSPPPIRSRNAAPLAPRVVRPYPTKNGFLKYSRSLHFHDSVEPTCRTDITVGS